MRYTAHDSKAAFRDFEDRNILFDACVIIGITSASNLNKKLCDKSYEWLLSEYEAHKDSIVTCARGARHVCDLVRKDKTHIRKTKCTKYANTKKGKSFYSDTDIIAFTKKILYLISNNDNIMKLIHNILKRDCNKNTINAGNPSLGDCVMHFFGFQYECLSKHVENRKNQNSHKTEALKKVLIEMDELLDNAGFPARC